MTDRHERTGDRRRAGGPAAERRGTRRVGRTRADTAESEEEARELTDVEEAEFGAEGVSGEAAEASGTVPGSVGGTTGTSGHAGGIQTPGATEPGIAGIDPDEVRGKVGRRRPKNGT
ncbi:MAG TPA: hypothetical protein VF212_06950 [Longimicrobiales bacterium]